MPVGALKKAQDKCGNNRPYGDTQDHQYAWDKQQPGGKGILLSQRETVVWAEKLNWFSHVSKYVGGFARHVQTHPLYLLFDYLAGQFNPRGSSLIQGILRRF